MSSLVGRRPLRPMQLLGCLRSRPCSCRVPSLRHSSSQQKRDLAASLQDALRDPSSPFYLAPGTQGPSDPGAGAVNPEAVPPDAGAITDADASRDGVLEVSAAARAEAREKLLRMGYDLQSFYEQTMVWGDLDSFRHLNNVRYVRFLESARIAWMCSLGRELGGAQRVRDMLAGRGVSLILKQLSVKFKRPVFFPDTLLIAHRPHELHPTQFSNAAAMWSYAQGTVVATSDSVLVWYDYDTLKKCDPGPETHAVLEGRVRPPHS